MDANSRQVGGNHYSKHNPEPWDVYANWFGDDGFRGYMRGTILKYLVRYPDKGGVQDLRKARHFIDKLIEFEEAKEVENASELSHEPISEFQKSISR